jgi:hypothetical protein
LSLEPAETEKARRPDVAALLLGLALLALAALVAWDASRLGGGATYAQVGPKSFPYVIAGGLTLLSAWTMVAAWLGDVPAREPDEVAPILWIVGGLVAQMLLLGVAGFSIATGVADHPGRHPCFAGPVLRLQPGAAADAAWRPARTAVLRLRCRASPISARDFWSPSSRPSSCSASSA